MERHVATDVDGGLVCTAAARPDLVVVDRCLPEGPRLVAFIRRDPVLCHAAIAILSNGAQDAREVALIAAGADVVLRLPVTPDWESRLRRVLAIAS